MKKLLPLAVIGLVTGCGDFAQSVRVRAAADFRCPEDRIALSDAEPYAQPKAYLAEGCGQSQAYEGGCDLKGCLVEKVPSAGERAERAARARQRRAADPAPAEATPRSVSLTLRNECPRTVKVFFGDDPKYSGGTLSTLTGNSIGNYSFNEGELIWLVDEARNELSSVSVNHGMRRIKVTKSCTGFAPDD